MKTAFNLPLRAEIHSAHLINKPGPLVSIKRNDRLSIIRFFAKEIGNMGDLSIINVAVDKQGKAADYDVCMNAWRALIQRFSNTMRHRNFFGPANADDKGLILPDMGEVKKVTRILRKMRRFNPVPNQLHYGQGYRDLRITNIVDDPFFKDSRTSYFLQAADLAAFLLYQRFAPSSFAQKHGVGKYFEQYLSPALCRVASLGDPHGIVML